MSATFSDNGTLTVGNVSVWPYDGNYQPQNTFWYWPQTIEKEVEPKSCMGKAHVFECEHVEACKCGAIQRVMPKAKTAKRRK